MPSKITRNGKTTEYKNLRGIVEELGKNTAATLTLDPAPDFAGKLTITFTNGTIAEANFASYTVMESWVNNRRNLKHLTSNPLPI